MSWMRMKFLLQKRPKSHTSSEPASNNNSASKIRDVDQQSSSSARSKDKDVGKSNVCSLVAPCCKCKKCEPWNARDALYNEPTDYLDTQTEKQPLPKIHKPRLLLWESKEPERTNIQVQNFSSTLQGKQRAMAPVVLVHG